MKNLDIGLNGLKMTFESAEALLQKNHCLNACFMCQQAIEKLVKGIYILYLDDNNIPLVHEINTIFDKFKDRLPMEKPQDKEKLFSILTSYYLNNRYPDYKQRMNEQTNKAKAAEIYSQTKEAFEWLLTLKP